MLVLTKLIGYLFGTLVVVYGCSEPEGGYREPTPADNVHYSKHVVVGEVTDLLRPDPMFGDMYDSTYGAMVDVKCTYKGGPLPARIKIGGAGFIPGHCTSKDLQKGKEYIMFLRGKRQNQDMYEQSQSAAPKEKLADYLNVCDLNMEYPTDQGMMLKRAECPAATKLDTCQRHGDEQTNTPVVVEKVTEKQRPLVLQGQAVSAKKETPSVGKSTTDEENTASTNIFSFATILFSFMVNLCF